MSGLFHASKLSMHLHNVSPTSTDSKPTKTAPLKSTDRPKLCSCDRRFTFKVYRWCRVTEMFIDCKPNNRTTCSSELYQKAMRPQITLRHISTHVTRYNGACNVPVVCHCGARLVEIVISPDTDTVDSAQHDLHFANIHHQLSPPPLKMLI